MIIIIIIFMLIFSLSLQIYPSQFKLLALEPTQEMIFGVERADCCNENYAKHIWIWTHSQNLATIQCNSMKRNHYGVLGLPFNVRKLKTQWAALKIRKKKSNFFLVCCSIEIASSKRLNKFNAGWVFVLLSRKKLIYSSIIALFSYNILMYKRPLGETTAVSYDLRLWPLKAI